jgi:hypothetical protein
MFHTYKAHLSKEDNSAYGPKRARTTKQHTKVKGRRGRGALG